MTKLLKTLGAILRRGRNKSVSLDRIDYISIRAVATGCKPRNNGWGINSYFK